MAATIFAWAGVDRVGGALLAVAVALFVAVVLGLAGGALAAVFFSPSNHELPLKLAVVQPAKAKAKTPTANQSLLPVFLPCPKIIAMNPDPLKNIAHHTASPAPRQASPKHPTKTEKRRHWRRGQWAEHFAIFWLYWQGYRLVQRHCRTPLGEIDLVMRRRGVWHFVEVKYRKTSRAALLSLTPAQQQRLSRAGLWFLAQKHLSPSSPCCFSLLALAPWQRPRFVHNAW
jgi:putative endonuclease